MTEIAPTTAVSVLANQLAAPAAPVLPPGLPATLPVQIITLPPALTPAALQNAQNLTGALALQPRDQAVLQTAAGAVTLAMPQLRGNPTLLQAVKHYLQEHGAVTLQLQAAPGGGAPAAQLVFAPVPAGAGRGAALPTASAVLNGQTLPALVLPADKADGQTATAAPSAILNRQADQTSSAMRLDPKVATWLQQWLGTVVAAHTTKAGDTQTPLEPQQRLMVAAKAMQSPLAVMVQQILPPEQAAPALRADEVLARVLRPAAAGQGLLVNSSEVTIMLKTSQVVPAGSQLVLKLLPPQLTAPGQEPAGAGHDWPALQELLNGLQAGVLPPSGAWQNFAQHRVPRPDNALAGALLVMLGAMRQQDPRLWLGKDNVAALEQGGRKTVLEALQQELQQHGGTTTDAVVGDWRVYQLPLLDQQHVLPLQIYVHHNQQRRDDGQAQDAATLEKTQQTRFVIDVTFSRLGAMQLDGFVKQQQFDLVLRTAQPLTVALQQELQAAFQSAVLATGYQGQMLFQNGRQHWLQLAPQVHGSRQA